MTNSRFEELERRCKKIKDKKIIKFIIFTLFLALLVAVSYWAVVKYPKLDNTVKTKNTTPVKKVISKTEKSTSKPTLKLEPVIKIPKVTTKPHIQKKKETVQKKEKQKAQNLPKKPKTTVKKEVIKPILKIVTQNADKETVLLKNYSINKDFSSALKLAKYYFKQKDYKKALYWAKNANKLDSTKDDSWIVYAKSKYALGKEEDAIESLKTFLSIFYSKRATELLNRYEKGQK